MLQKTWSTHCHTILKLDFRFEWNGKFIFDSKDRMIAIEPSAARRVKRHSPDKEVTKWAFAFFSFFFSSFFNLLRLLCSGRVSLSRHTVYTYSRPTGYLIHPDLDLFSISRV